MKRIVLKTLKITSIGALLFFGYANLQPPPLHSFAPDSNLAVFDVNNLNSAMALSNSKDLEKTNGIIAYSLNEKSSKLGITFNPEVWTLPDLTSYLASDLNLDARISTLELETESNQPQCPIPHGWISQFNKVKYSLNIHHLLYKI